MSLIQNLVARLTMDSTAFDRNAKASSKSMYGMIQQTRATQQAFAGMAAAGAKIAAVTAVAYAAYRGIKSLTAATVEAERSEQGMISALRVRGQYSQQTVDLLRQQAEAMQDVTRFSRNEIEQAQSLALTMGAGVPELQQMTEAAIGLSVAYNRDLLAAMRLVSLARQGETGQIKEMGIVLDRSRTKQQQYVQLQEIGRKQMTRAREDADTLGGSIAQVGNEWAATKDAIVRPFVPALVGALKAIREGMDSVQKSADAASNAISVFSDNANPLMLPGMASQFRVGSGSRFRFGRETKLRADEQGNVAVKPLQETARLGGDGASAAAAIPAAQREQIVKLNGQLKEQIAIQREVNAGNLHAAETVRYAAAAEDAYGKGTKEAEGAIIKYNSALQTLDDLRSRQAASDYLKDLQDQEQILQLQRAGLDDQAQLQQVLNDFRRQGIELTEEETDAIAEQIDRVSDIEDHYQSLGEGIQGAFAEIRDEMQTAGDLAHDVVKVGFEGVADSIAAAVVEGENLGDALRNVGQEIATMLVKWAAMQAMNAILPGSGSTTALVGHEGGVIGSGGFASRQDSPSRYLGVPRLHDGLKPDEFRFIGQRGEKITSKSGVASENKLLSRIASLLERRQSVNLNASIVDRRDVVTRERLESREGEQMVMYHVGRNQ